MFQFIRRIIEKLKYILPRVLPPVAGVILFISTVVSMGVISNYINDLEIVASRDLYIDHNSTIHNQQPTSYFPDENERVSYLYPNFTHARNGLLVMNCFLVITIIGQLVVNICNFVDTYKYLFHYSNLTILTLRCLFSLIFLLDPTEAYIPEMRNYYYFFMYRNQTISYPHKALDPALTQTETNYLESFKLMYDGEIAALVVVLLVGPIFLNFNKVLSLLKGEGWKDDTYVRPKKVEAKQNELAENLIQNNQEQEEEL